jgi:hypothetical protein
MSFSPEYTGQMDIIQYPFTYEDASLEAEKIEMIDNFDLWDHFGFNFDGSSVYQYPESTHVSELPYFGGKSQRQTTIDQEFRHIQAEACGDDTTRTIEPTRTSQQPGVYASNNPLPLEEDLDKYVPPQRGYLKMASSRKNVVLNGSDLETQRISKNQSKEKNKYPERIKSFNVSQFYDTLPIAPIPWGSDKKPGESRFSYDKYGELDVTLTFSTEEIIDYLYSNPAHYTDGGYFPKHGNFVLWIQACPAKSSNRYPYKGSDKCRFTDCPMERNTISKGSFRVAFDEHAKSAIKVDPYHCAGFVHLFCLEKFLDFPQLCRDIKVQPDCRELPEGKNKMAITRDHPGMEKIVQEHINGTCPGSPLSYKDTLTSKLTVHHVCMEFEGRQRSREKRGGNHIGIHKGNLDVYAAGQQERKKPRKVAVSKQDGARKRNYPSSLETSSSGEGGELEWRAVKRARML